MEAEKLAFRIEEAAQVIGVSRSTLFALVAEGSLPARKIGRATVILRGDLMAFLEAAPRVKPSRGEGMPPRI